MKRIWSELGDLFDGWYSWRTLPISTYFAATFTLFRVAFRAGTQGLRRRRRNVPRLLRVVHRLDLEAGLGSRIGILLIAVSLVFVGCDLVNRPSSELEYAALMYGPRAARGDVLRRSR